MQISIAAFFMIAQRSEKPISHWRDKRKCDVPTRMEYSVIKRNVVHTYYKLDGPRNHVSERSTVPGVSTALNPFPF